MNGMAKPYRRFLGLVLTLLFFPGLAVAAGVQPRFDLTSPGGGPSPYAAGDPIEASSAFRRFLHSGQAPDPILKAYRMALWFLLARARWAGVSEQQIALASVFTTQGHARLHPRRQQRTAPLRLDGNRITHPQQDPPL